MSHTIASTTAHAWGDDDDITWAQEYVRQNVGTGEMRCDAMGWDSAYTSAHVDVVCMHVSMDMS